MRLRNRLTVKQVASLTVPKTYADGGGLYVRVRPAGTKSWLFVKMVDGKRREVGLGPVLDVSLAEAREEASKLRRAFREGRDPVADRRASRGKRSAAPATFGAFAEQFMDRIVAGYRNDKHQQQWYSTVRTYAQALYPIALADIDTRDIVGVLEPIWLEKSETAGRVRQRLERILNGARLEGLRTGENPARLRGHLDQLLPRQDRKPDHHSALDYRSLPQFMAKLAKRQGNAARALEFTILTAARTGQTLDMTWGEVDSAERLWTVPGPRMKAGEEHQVPLSEASLRVLEAVRRDGREPSDKVFDNGKGSSLSNMAMAQVLRRMGETNITVHGFRSTFRDWVGETTTFAREEAEMALAHQVGGKTERAYRRGRSLAKRRAMMDVWAAYAWPETVVG